MLFTSCQEELENWYSATADYDGRYVVATTCEEYSSDDTSIEDGLEVMIYNTAENKANEIWLDTEVAGAHIKGKFALKGSSVAFTDSTTQVANVASSTIYAFTSSGGLTTVAGLGTPTAAGLENDGVQLYTRITLLEGKILPQKATSIGGNTSDSIYVKTIMHHDYVVLETYQTPEEDWDNPLVPEFAWRKKAGSNTPADDDGWNETWTLTGYRYTGMPEDVAH